MHTEVLILYIKRIKNIFMLPSIICDLEAAINTISSRTSSTDTRQYFVVLKSIAKTIYGIYVYCLVSLTVHNSTRVFDEYIYICYIDKNLQKCF